MAGAAGAQELRNDVQGCAHLYRLWVQDCCCSWNAKLALRIVTCHTVHGADVTSTDTE
jgi:hypothetical protein